MAAQQLLANPNNTTGGDDNRGVNGGNRRPVYINHQAQRNPWWMRIIFGESGVHNPLSFAILQLEIHIGLAIAVFAIQFFIIHKEVIPILVEFGFGGKEISVFGWLSFTLNPIAIFFWVLSLIAIVVLIFSGIKKGKINNAQVPVGTVGVLRVIGTMIPIYLVNRDYYLSKLFKLEVVKITEQQLKIELAGDGITAKGGGRVKVVVGGRTIAHNPFMVAQLQSTVDGGFLTHIKNRFQAIARGFTNRYTLEQLDDWVTDQQHTVNLDEEFRGMVITSGAGVYEIDEVIIDETLGITYTQLFLQEIIPVSTGVLEARESKVIERARREGNLEEGKAVAQIMKTILKGNSGEIGTDGSIISDSHPEYLPPNPRMEERDAKALAERIMGLRKGSEEWIHIGEDPQVGNFFSAGILKFFGNMMRNPGGDQGGKGGKKGDGGGKGGKKK